MQLHTSKVLGSPNEKLTYSNFVDSKYQQFGIGSLKAEEKKDLFSRHSIEDMRDIANHKPIGYYRAHDRIAADKLGI